MERARKLKYILAAGALVLLAANLVLERSVLGAQLDNLGLITFQPMEFVKVAFVLATATLDRLLTTRNITAFIALPAFHWRIDYHARPGNRRGLLSIS